MRYEKKMLILSGEEGKGVVLIERSGLGVRFAVRTFSLPACNGLMAGVITKSDVFIRELPATKDPSAVFYLDEVDIPSLHFAVFDERLRLYGTFGKKMWESNVMGLLLSKLKPVGTPPPPSLPVLPPIVERPEVLPLPDGTGIPQSRLSVYGDEALAESDFYTTYDFSSRMRKVDEFLDSPRVLDGLAPTVTRSPLKSPSLPQSDIYTPMSSVTVRLSAVETQAPPAAIDEVASVSSMAQSVRAEEIEHGDAVVGKEEVSDMYDTDDRSAVESTAFESSAIDATAMNETSASEMATASATAATETAAATDAIAEKDDINAVAEQPWQYEAMFLRKRSNRVPIVKRPAVVPPTTAEKVPHIRETAFIERCRADIDKLFSIAERDNELTGLLPDIEWVRVDFDGHTVAVGRSKVFLCYAVAGRYEKVSPLGEEAQWLPSVKSMPTGKGYWLIFQDLATGEIIRTC